MSDFSEGMAVGQSIGNGANNGFNDGWWILLLLLCGWGNGNWAGNGGGNQMVGYELGRVATTNDVAADSRLAQLCLLRETISWPSSKVLQTFSRPSVKVSMG